MIMLLSVPTNNHHLSRDRCIALAISLVTLAIYLLAASLRIQSIDEIASLVIARNLAWRGAFDVDWLAWVYPIMGTGSVAMPGIDGHMYGLKDIGPSLLLAPLVRLASVMGVSPTRMSFMLSPLITAGVAGGLYLCVRHVGYQRRTAVAAALVYGLATMAFPYSRSLFTQVFAAPGMLIALWGVIDAVSTRCRRSALLGGIGMGIAGISVNAMWATVPLYLLYMLQWESWRGRQWPGEIGKAAKLAVPFVAGAVPFVLLQAAYNTARFGAPYLTGHQQAGASDLRLLYIGIGAFGQLLSTPRGIVWYIPVSMLVPFGVWLVRKEGFAARPIWLALAQGVLVFGLYSSYWQWWGGGAYGPRFLVVIMPALALLITPALDRVWLARGWIRAAVGGLIGASIVIQTINSLFDIYPPDQPMYKGLWEITPPPAFWVHGSVLTDFSQLLYLRMWQLLVGDYWDVLWLAHGTMDWLLFLSQCGLIALGISLLAMTLSRAARHLSRWGVIVQMVLTVLVMLLMLYRYPYPKAYASYEGKPLPELDRLIAYIEQHASPTDTVITLLPIHLYDWLDHYPARVADTGLTIESPLRSETVQALDGIRKRSTQVLVVTETTFSGDSNNGVERWLAERTFAGSEEQFEPFRVMTYGLYPQVGSLKPASAAFGDARFQLIGYSVGIGRTSTRWSVNVLLRWKALRKGDGLFTVFVHVLNADGSLLGQHDGVPQAGFAPTSSWEAGQVIDDRHHIQLPLDTAAGQYPLMVGLYDSASGNPLLTDSTGQKSFHIDVVRIP